jgi:phosphate transport system substrate-binding protein
VLIAALLRRRFVVGRQNVGAFFEICVDGEVLRIAQSLWRCPCTERLPRGVMHSCIEFDGMDIRRGQPNQIRGAGSTAIYPLMAVWSQRYRQHSQVEIRYAPVGSGRGASLLKSGGADFAILDHPLTKGELTGGGLVQFPIVCSSLVVAVNLPGVATGDLVLSGNVFAEICMGRIARWNDVAIQSLNPDAALPDLAIRLVHRSDQSGGSERLVEYLAAVSAAWRETTGFNAVTWPPGIETDDNAGVANAVQQTLGSLGYVEYSYAAESRLSLADLINSDGERVRASPATFQASAEKSELTADGRYCLAPCVTRDAQCWPITNATYIAFSARRASSSHRKAVAFLDWTLNSGRNDATQIGYAPLPDDMAGKIVALQKTLFGESAPPRG